MMTFSQPKLEIVRCDNGYAVEWCDDSNDRNDRRYREDPPPPTAGIMIFKTKKELVTYVQGFFTGP